MQGRVRLVASCETKNTSSDVTQAIIPDLLRVGMGCGSSALGEMGLDPDSDATKELVANSIEQGDSETPNFRKLNVKMKSSTILKMTTRIYCLPCLSIPTCRFVVSIARIEVLHRSNKVHRCRGKRRCTAVYSSAVRIMFAS